MAGAVLEVSDATFQREVLEEKNPVLVDFWAPWCGPCKAQGPIIDQIATEAGGRLKVVKVNVDQCPRVAETYRIKGIPALFFFRNGRPAGEMVGLQTKQAILAKFNGLAATSSSDDPVSDSVVVACASCGQKNRVPQARMGEAICGRCGLPLARGV